jgi:hypothetical protein
MLAEYFVDVDVLSSTSRNLQDWVTIVAAFALGLGAYSLLKLHVGRVSSRHKEYPKSIVLMVCFLAFFIVGLQSQLQSDLYQWMYLNIYSATVGGLNSYLIFFLSAAAFRTFRVRNKLTTLMLVVAGLVLLGAAPVGNAIWDGLPKMYQWIMDIPTSAGQRGMLIAAGIGAAAFGIRVLIGKEKAMGGSGE